MSQKEFLNSDVLKVAHRGSITSATQQLLNLITPDMAVISVGKNNKFKYHSPIVLMRLVRSGSRIIRTDENGAIWIHSDGESIMEINWR